MASAYSPRWRRLLRKCAPFLFKECRGGNFHWCWDRLCFCCQGEHTGDWHGGIHDMKTGEEYHVGQTPGERRLDQKYRMLWEIVNAQKNLAILWGNKDTTQRERRLQYELNRLHSAIEAEQRGRNGRSTEEREGPLGSTK